MRTRVELVARRAAGSGRTALAVNRAEGILNARRTGESEVHLVGTGAGPLGGDVVEVDVVVEAGARLSLRGVAATLSMPDRDGRPAQLHVHLRVSEGASLDVALEPLVAVRGSDLHVTTTAVVADDGALDLTEAVVLGRWREAPGRWRGTLRADLLEGGRPRAWLRQSVALGPGAPAWTPSTRPACSSAASGARRRCPRRRRPRALRGRHRGGRGRRSGARSPSPSPGEESSPRPSGATCSPRAGT